eukprot:6676473-Pyramimonas_sp.AAC.1
MRQTESARQKLCTFCVRDVGMCLRAHRAACRRNMQRGMRATLPLGPRAPIALASGLRGPCWPPAAAKRAALSSSTTKVRCRVRLAQFQNSVSRPRERCAPPSARHAKVWPTEHRQGRR